jgi:hypothetical protein
MNFKNFVCLALLGCMVVLTGCSSSSYYIPGTGSPTIGLEGLKRDEFEVLGDVEKRGCASRYFLFWSYSDTNGISHAFQDLKELAMADAMNQINAIREYDAIIAPRSIIETRSIPPVYAAVCATIRAKGVSIDKAVDRAAPMGAGEPQ